MQPAAADAGEVPVTVEKKTDAPSASARVRGEWARRVQAEYTSCAISTHLSLWLVEAGASPDLIRAAWRVAQDELVHAEQAHAVLSEAAGGLDGPIDRRRLSLPRTPGAPVEHDILRVAVQVFCLGETVAVPLFRQLRARCTVPVARTALDRVLRDEVRHRALGWTLLDWLLATQPEPDRIRRRVAEDLLPLDFLGLMRSYSGFAEASMPDAERAWGLMPGDEYAAVLQVAWQRNFQPWFAERGIDAEPAWQAATARFDPSAVEDDDEGEGPHREA